MTLSTPNTQTPLPVATGTSKQSWWMILILGFSLLAIFTVCLFYQLSQPPRDFPTNRPLIIESGSSVDSILEQVVEEKYARSSFVLYLYLFLNYDIETATIHAGQYTFSAPASSGEVIEKLLSKQTEQQLVTLTIPEGVSRQDIAQIAKAKLPNFDSATFLASTTDLEGRLWPDTYYVPIDYTTTDLIELLNTTHVEQIMSLRSELTSHNLSLDEILILASIIEREANSPESMAMVSGILQNRLSIGMALQADATIEYVIDTPLSDLPAGQLATELRTTDSPYNTYLYPGLPPTPIGNPGLAAIQAVLQPTNSDYLFYITGNDGEFYYAESLAEHNQNINAYLR